MSARDSGADCLHSPIDGARWTSVRLEVKCAKRWSKWDQIKTSRFNEEQFASINGRANGGVPVVDLCREHGISKSLAYKWRSMHGGASPPQIRRMKELVAEKNRLKGMIAEREVQTELLKDALGTDL